jgi:hypothetical protein
LAIAGSRLSTMENPRFSITTSVEFATLLHTQNTHEGHTGHLASVASLHYGQHGLDIKHRQRYYSPWAEQSRISAPPHARASAIRRSPGTDAAAIPRVDRSAARVKWSNTAGPSRFVSGGIYLKSAILVVVSKFHFRVYPNCFCLLLTSSPFGCAIYPIPGTFHRKRWSL